MVLRVKDIEAILNILMFKTSLMWGFILDNYCNVWDGKFFVIEEFVFG